MPLDRSNHFCNPFFLDPSVREDPVTGEMELEGADNGLALH